jgi:asparagine synthase (glutamine-hydrolysing)
VSGIVGIYHVNGRLVDRQLIERMSDAIAHRGRDEGGVWVDGPVGMGHRMCHTTPESLFEKQPLTDEMNRLCLVYDGRVDNRDELKKSLEEKDVRLRDETDGEIILKLYKSYGESFIAKIIGDFAMVIWDKTRRKLLCARDFIGLKPLFYHFDGNTFRWASEFHALFEDFAVRQDPNEGLVGEYLAGQIRTPSETLYQGIHRVLPAHLLIVDSLGIRQKRYWDLDPRKEIRFSTDREYGEHFYDLFRDAVQCRMRSIGPVGAELSGGLDSSSVVGMMQGLLQDNVLRVPGVETFSLVFPDRKCDESPYIRDVVEKWRLKSHQTCPQPASLELFTEHSMFYKDFPGYPTGSITDPFKQVARERGVRVVLTGEGGDERFATSFHRYIDLLGHLKIREALSGIYQEYGWQGPGNLLREAVKVCLWPSLPRISQRLIRYILKRPEVPPWINAQFARRIDLADRLRQQAYLPKQGSFAQQDLFWVLTDAWNVNSFELLDRGYASFCVERRHPFLDRRLVEFGLALPEDQRQHEGVTKVLLRRAMNGLLPDSVRDRRDKAEFSQMFADQFSALGGATLFKNLGVESRGFVIGDRVQQMYSQMERFASQDFPGPVTYVWLLWMIWGVELWLNTNIWLASVDRQTESAPRAVASGLT